VVFGNRKTRQWTHSNAGRLYSTFWSNLNKNISFGVLQLHRWGWNLAPPSCQISRPSVQRVAPSRRKNLKIGLWVNLIRRLALGAMLPIITNSYAMYYLSPWVCYSTPNLALVGKRGAVQEQKCPKCQNLPKIVVFGHRKPTQWTHSDEISRVAKFHLPFVQL